MMGSKHKVANYLIEDFIKLEWEPDYSTMMGNSGCFSRIVNGLRATSFAQLYAPVKNIQTEWDLVPDLRVGALWFEEAQAAISGVSRRYSGFSIFPDQTVYKAPEYSFEFLKEVSYEMVSWVENVDVGEALRLTAQIPQEEKYHNNSFTYITALALTGQIDILEQYKGKMMEEKEVPLVGYVKSHHVDNAIAYGKKFSHDKATGV